MTEQDTLLNGADVELAEPAFRSAWDRWEQERDYVERLRRQYALSATLRSTA
jgi:hypothetical protein